MAGQRISTIVEVVASNTAERWRRSADYMCDGIADEIEINRALHTAYLMNTGDGAVGQLQGGTVHVAPGRYVLNSPIVVPGRVMLEFDQGAEIMPGPGYLSGGTYAGCPLIAHYTARGLVSSATATTMTTATYVDVDSGATKTPLTHVTTPAVAGSQASQPLIGAWIYVDHGGAGANLLAGRITAMSTNAMTATVNSWTNVTGAAGTPSAGERFWVGPDPANGNTLFFPGIWQMRQGDRMHIKGGRFFGNSAGHICGGLYTVVTCQNIWLPGSATTYPFFEGYPDSGHVVEGMKFSECAREAIITACGGSGTTFSFDNKGNTYRDIQTWHCGVSGSYASVWFGSVDSTFSDNVVASSGSATVGGGLAGAGIYVTGGNSQIRQCYVSFTNGVGVVMATARNHLSSCSIQDSKTMGLHMFADRCTAADVTVDNSWNNQTTPVQRPAIYQEGGNSYCTAFVTNRSTEGAATHAIRFGAAHGIFAHVVGRNVAGGGVIDSRGTATQETGHTVVAASTTNVNTVDSTYSVGLGLGAQHTHGAISIVDFTEVVRDTMGAALVAGPNVTIAPNDAAETITISSAGGGGGGGSSTTFLMSSYGLATGNTGANAALNTTAIRNAIAACFAAGGGDVLFDVPGTYEVALSTSPGASSTWTRCVAAIRSNVYLRGCGRNLVTLKLAANPNAGFVTEQQARFFINWNPNSSGTVDQNFGVMDITLDGNCANAGAGTGTGTGWQIMHGIQWWYARNTLVKNCIIKNMRGNNASSEEVFHCDALRCQDVRVIDTLCLGDDGGNTSSGFSMNWVDRFWVDRCSSIGMKTGQAYTWFSSANGMTSNCYAGDTGRYGFNLEHSWDLAYVNCHSGSESPWSTSDNLPVVYTQGDSHPNARSYMINLTDGGGRISYVNCTARGGTEANIGLIGSLTATATTGTTGSTVVVTTSSFFSAAWIGRYIKVGTGSWVRISGYTSGTTVTTAAAHGGASGNTVLIQSGDISWTGGNISGGEKGIQLYDGTSELKLLTIRRSDFTGASFDANTTCDMEDVGNSVGRQVIASGAATTARTDQLVAGTEFYNPFPMEMRVCTTSASGAVNIRGRNPTDTPTPTGQTGQATYIVPCGGAITIATSVAGVTWWYPR